MYKIISRSDLMFSPQISIINIEPWEIYYVECYTYIYTYTIADKVLI